MRRIILCLTVFALFFPSVSPGAQITNIETRIMNDEVVVSAGLSLDEKNLEDIRKGISREITIYIDIFRAWKTWPDEFVAGKKLIRILKSDPVKNEHIATSSDYNALVKKRFKDFDSMLQWALHIRNLGLAGIKELEPADYFVRVTAESRIRTLPPVIGYLLFFVPEREFRITRDSGIFTAGRPK